MASRKNLKKNVNYIFGELFAECWICSIASQNANKQTADEILNDILVAQNEFVSRISHTEPGNVKGFYRKFRADFDKSVEGIIAKIDALN